MTGFRTVDKRYPPPPAPPAPPRPPTVWCFNVVANPNTDDPRRCYAEPGHEGIHVWESCAEYWFADGMSHPCERLIGHDGQHHVEIDWD